MPKIRPTVLFLFDLCAGYSKEFPRPQGGPFEASCSPPSSPCCPIVNPKIVSRPQPGTGQTCPLILPVRYWSENGIICKFLCLSQGGFVSVIGTFSDNQGEEPSN